MKLFKALSRASKVTLLFCFGILDLQAQSDTVLLKEVVISGLDPSRYLPGGQHVTLNADSLHFRDLSQALSGQIPVYFVQYGAPGQLSSINLRGLGAARSSLVWQGMEINSFTLGQSDFSEVTSGNADEIKVQLGSVGALYGNGAIGGTIILNSSPELNRGHSISFNQEFGSFGFFGTGVRYKFSNSKLSLSSKLIYRTSENDFKYSQKGTKRRQHNAGYDNFSLIQGVEYLIDQRHQLSFHFWFQQHQREIQPHRDDLNGDDYLENQNTRISASWQRQSNKWSGELRLGYTNDNQIYNRSSNVEVDRLFGSYEIEWQKSGTFSLRGGMNANHLIARVDAYAGKIRETRGDLYSSALWDLSPKTSMGLSFRAPSIDGEIKSVAPLWSLSYLFLEKERVRLSADWQISRSYRLPTLNDRYWQPGGNPNLNAETSNNIESGISGELKIGTLTYEGSVRYFRHHVSNWIIWIPGGREEDPSGEVISFWFPENIREVLATGLEYYHSLKWQLPAPQWSTTMDIQGSYNQALNKRAISSLDRSLNKQLPYTPKYLINGNWQLHFQQWSLGLMAQYRSKRFVEANNELPALPHYTLWRFQLGKTGSWKNLSWQANLAVNNLFDAQYEDFENRAMPGRNYQLKITINHNN